jgi:LuxR family transcriptional regulator of csgAB operon
VDSAAQTHVEKKYYMGDVHNKSIFILGPENLNNQFLAYTINHELKIPTQIYNAPIKDFPEGIEQPLAVENNRGLLHLIDCGSFEIDDIFSALVANQALSHGLLAMYNLRGYSDIEGRALIRHVRGFFYVDDHMKTFLKGITSVFNGEVWISRQILLKYAMTHNPGELSPSTPNTSLSPRERQILSLVSLGANNEEISDKLCISINTVRTHMYHIFRKLGVSNRLQAALWAAKNL